MKEKLTNENLAALPLAKIGFLTGIVKITYYDLTHRAEGKEANLTIVEAENE